MASQLGSEKLKRSIFGSHECSLFRLTDCQANMCFTFHCTQARSGTGAIAVTARNEMRSRVWPCEGQRVYPKLHTVLGMYCRSLPPCPEQQTASLLFLQDKQGGQNGTTRTGQQSANTLSLWLLSGSPGCTPHKGTVPCYQGTHPSSSAQRGR